VSSAAGTTLLLTALIVFIAIFAIATLREVHIGILTMLPFSSSRG
jgi:hypothetical protein